MSEIYYEPFTMKDIMRTYVISRMAYYDFLGMLYRYIGMIRGRTQKSVIEELVELLKAAGYYTSTTAIKEDFAAYKKIIGLGVKHKKLYSLNPWVFRRMRAYAGLVNDKDMVNKMIEKLQYDEPADAMRKLDREIKIEKAKQAGLIRRS